MLLTYVHCTHAVDNTCMFPDTVPATIARNLAETRISDVQMTSIRTPPWRCATGWYSAFIATYSMVPTDDLSGKVAESFSAAGRPARGEFPSEQGCEEPRCHDKGRSSTLLAQWCFTCFSWFSDCKGKSGQCGSACMKYQYRYEEAVVYRCL